MPDIPDPDRSLAIKVAERIMNMQNFLKGFRSKERWIECFPQREKKLQEDIRREEMKVAAAQRDLAEVMKKYNEESAEVQRYREYLKNNRTKYEEYETLIETTSLEQAQKLKDLTSGM